MKKLLLFSSLLTILLFLCNCEKDIPSIPTEEELLNTNAEEFFACLVNGAYWGSNDINSSYSVIATTLNVEAYKGSGHFINFSGFIPDTGLHTLSDAAMRNRPCSYTESEMDTLINAVNILRLDTEEGIMIGTFEFNLVRSGESCSNIPLKISEGRFKIQI